MLVGRQRLLVVGLGNLPFPRTRHSVGHLIVDSLAARLGVRLSQDKCPADGYWAQKNVDLDDKPVQLTLFKPSAYMNVLGGAVATVCRKTVPSPASMIVIHDSLDHMQKTVNLKPKGSANGHRGVLSVQSALSDDKFYRMRVGIGRRGDARDYVLEPLEAYEKEYWGENGEGIDAVWQLIEVASKRRTQDR